jgi:heptaprenyl diphosphate synthase
VTLSVLFIFGPSSWVIAPPFLILGTAAGIVVGLIAERFGASSRWIERLRADYHEIRGSTGETP